MATIAIVGLLSGSPFRVIRYKATRHLMASAIDDRGTKRTFAESLLSESHKAELCRGRCLHGRQGMHSEGNQQWSEGQEKRLEARVNMSLRTLFPLPILLYEDVLQCASVEQESGSSTVIHDLDCGAVTSGSMIQEWGANISYNRYGRRGNTAWAIHPGA
jgi:hypothetical protein